MISVCSGNNPRVPCWRKRRVRWRTVSVCVRFLRSLRRGAIFDEDHGTNQLIAPLDVIDKAELELVEIWHCAHLRFSPLSQMMGGWLQQR